MRLLHKRRQYVLLDKMTNISKESCCKHEQFDITITLRRDTYIYNSVDHFEAQ